MTYESSPLQQRAQRAVRNAVARGRLLKPTKCAECHARAPRIEAHHDKGYEPDHWLTVIWLCTSCHRRISPPRRRTPIADRIARAARARRWSRRGR